MVCQPLSACSFCMAATVRESHAPVGSPVRYPCLMSADWIWVARSESIPTERVREEVACVVLWRTLAVDSTVRDGLLGGDCKRGGSGEENRGEKAKCASC